MLKWNQWTEWKVRPWFSVEPLYCFPQWLCQSILSPAVCEAHPVPASLAISHPRWQPSQQLGGDSSLEPCSRSPALDPLNNSIHLLATCVASLERSIPYVWLLWNFGQVQGRSDHLLRGNWRGLPGSLTPTFTLWALRTCWEGLPSW